MSFTADIYNEIKNDIKKADKSVTLRAMRKITCNNGTEIVFSINISSGMKELYFCIGNYENKTQFPRWKGIDIDIVKLPAYGTNDNYVALMQIPDSEGYIFEIIAEDLRLGVEQLKHSEDTLKILVMILTKWKDFFQTEKELLMSEERQQGLYGELLFLAECINEMGIKSVAHWAGSDAETHDFYIGSSAVEIKTTSSKSPYYAHISSEYQLDDKDIPGELLMRMYALRKSQSTGESLPEIVSKIREILQTDQKVLQQFNAKLLKYGYWDEASEYYTTGYFVRDNYYFSVCTNFPRLIKTDIPNGVSDIKYAVSIAQCMEFSIDKKEAFLILKGGTSNA